MVQPFNVESFTFILQIHNNEHSDIVLPPVSRVSICFITNTH